MTRTRILRFLAATAALSLACTGVAAGSAAALPAAAVAEQGAGLPAIDVVRVSTGESVPLKSVAVAGKPTLLWFWAPHCPFCEAEAPDILSFQREHGADVHVIGMGAQDDLQQAEDFVARTLTAGLPMIWDARGSSWVHFRVTNQPAILVLSPEGKVTGRWFREYDEAGILRAAAAR
ncbi:MAG: TlpA family protein disulfide reductase [Sporichthyaceae bacterium]